MLVNADNHTATYAGPGEGENSSLTWTEAYHLICHLSTVSDQDSAYCHAETVSAAK